MVKRVFISKNASEVESLNTFLESKNSSLVAHSFLKFSPLNKDITQNYDVIFFGSPRAVSFFTAQHQIPKGAEIACVGGKTAQNIEDLDFQVAFNGDKKGTIDEVARLFKEWCGDKKVLFPISTRSLKTFSSLFENQQKVELEIYETLLVGQEIEPCDTYVFTSPSNLEGFLEMNSIPQNARVIAWGDSTKRALDQANIPVQFVLTDPTVEALIQYLG